MFDVSQTIISQYSSSPAITSLINSWNQAIDPAMSIQNFYDVVWNIQSASGFGLDNWGLILGVSRYLELPNADEYFGFAGTSNSPFNVAPWYIGGSTSSAFALSDTQYRQLLLAKAKSNISNCSIATLNQLAQAVFGTGAMFVVDLGNMAMEYVFTTVPTAVDQAIAENSGVLPHPTGVLTGVATGILSNAQLVAGTSGTEIGFGSGFGTLTPSSDVNGNTIASLYHNSTGPTFVLAIDSATSLTSSYFTYLLLQEIGAQLKASTASFNFSAGVNTWTWSSGLPTLTSGDQYTVVVF
jgi:Protein of unknown function (DUF2612)